MRASSPAVVLLDFEGSPDFGDLKAIADSRRVPFCVISGEVAAVDPSRATIVVNPGQRSLTGDDLDRFVGLDSILSCGVGTDWIDLPSATHRGILVANTPLANVEDVAVHTVALMLAGLRQLAAFDAQVRCGGFDPFALGELRRPSSLTLGLLAFGNIPRRVVELVRPLGMRILAHDPGVSDDVIRSHRVTPVTFDELLEETHVLSVHVPSNCGDRPILDEAAIGRLRRGAIVVITSRGTVYDPVALCMAMDSGQIAWAGIDVFQQEPPSSDDPIRTLARSLLTPHAAGYSEEALVAMGAAARQALTCLIDGREPPAVANAEVLSRWLQNVAAR